MTRGIKRGSSKVAEREHSALKKVARPMPAGPSKAQLRSEAKAAVKSFKRRGSAKVEGNTPQ